MPSRPRKGSFSRKMFYSIPVKEYRIPDIEKIKPFERILTATKSVQMMRSVGSEMQKRETRQLMQMQRYTNEYIDGLAMDLKKGRITFPAYESAVSSLRERIEQKLKRIESLVEKRKLLLLKRQADVQRFAMNERYLPDLLGHASFVEMVTRGFAKDKPHHTIGFVDVDYMKRINSKFKSQERGGAVVIRAFGSAAKQICDKYPGTVACRYGSDEFTFYSDCDASEMKNRMDEFIAKGREKLESTEWGRAILSGRPIGPEPKGLLSRVSRTSMGKGVLAARNKISDFSRRIGILPKFGTATGAVIEIDLASHFGNKQSRADIYSNVLHQVSGGALGQKKRRKNRGSVVIVKDHVPTPKAA